MHGRVYVDYAAMLAAIQNITPGQRVLVTADPYAWYSPMFRQYEASRTLFQAARDVVAAGRGVLFLKRQGGIARGSYLSYVLIGTSPGALTRLDQAVEQYWVRRAAMMPT